MNYKYIYKLIILNAKKRGLNKKILDGYYEIHHIKPRSLGGSDTKQNLVILNPKEHIICHHLLYKAYPNNKSLTYAYKMMSGFSRYDVKQTQHESQQLGYEFSQYMTNRVVSNETREKQSKIHKARWQTVEYKAKMDILHKSDEFRKKRSDCITEWIINNPDAFKARMDKINHNPEKIRKMAETHRGMKRSDKARQNMSDAAQGAHDGKCNSQWVGYYITPKGRFESPAQMAIAFSISPNGAYKRCKENNNKIITKHSVTVMHDVDISMIGKTWAELGWGFEGIK